MSRQRRYPVEGKGTEIPPSYDRVVEALSDEAIRDELEQERGSPEYRKALERELRAREAPPRR